MRKCLERESERAGVGGGRGRTFQEERSLRGERSPDRQGLGKEAKKRPVEGQGRAE